MEYISKNCPASPQSCAQLTPFQKLSLRKTLGNLSCSNSLLAAGDPAMASSLQSLLPAAIQLLYVDPNCEACMDSTKQCPKDCDCTEISYCQKPQTGCSSFKCNKGAIIGVIVTSVLLAIIVCMLVLLCVCYRRKARSAELDTKSISMQSSHPLITQRACLLSKKFGPIAAKEFSFKSLSKATKSFSDENMIGDGGFGVVYVGTLNDGCKIAIKRLYHDHFRRLDHFYNELQILSKLNHPNLVKLYGFCCEDSNDLLLVFEYVVNGTVFDQIHDTQKPAMPWKTRLRILRETAEALFYLHNCVKPPIYHRDVKTTNILLDEKLHVKLADFGLSRLVPLDVTHVSTAPQGTPGYLDPDYHQCYQLTDKSDVYSFGVVLVELVSAKLAVDMSRDRTEINLSSLALMKIGCGMWKDLVDPCLEINKNPEVEMMVKRVLELAFMCLHAEKDSRPTMQHVLESLSNLWDEFGYNDERENSDAFKMDINPNLSSDETKYLMRGQQKTKSRHAPSFTPTSSDSSVSYNSWSSGP